MQTAESAEQERRQFWDVRARIEQLEARSAAVDMNGYPDARGAKALVREQFRRTETEQRTDAPEQTV